MLVSLALKNTILLLTARMVAFLLGVTVAANIELNFRLM